MSGRLTPAWQRQRNAFNHDQLKNRYLPALAKCLNLLDDKIEDEAFEKSFLTTVLLDWERLQSEAGTLAGDFEGNMSPRGLLEESPLRRLDDPTREWMGELIHGLWLVRCKVKDLVAHALECIEATHKAYIRLQRRLSQDGGLSFRKLRESRSEFAAFHDCCRKLSQAFEAFPSEVRFT